MNIRIYGFAPKISDFGILWFVILQYFFGTKIGYIRFWQENTKFIRLSSIEFLATSSGASNSKSHKVVSLDSTSACGGFAPTAMTDLASVVDAQDVEDGLPLNSLRTVIVAQKIVDEKRREEEEALAAEPSLRLLY